MEKSRTARIKAFGILTVEKGIQPEKNCGKDIGKTYKKAGNLEKRKEERKSFPQMETYGEKSDS